jgi:hypothetical protein
VKMRLPLVGSINTRIGTNDQLPGASAIVGESIVGLTKVGTTPTGSSKDQRFINCFPVYYTNPATQSRTFYLMKRPGFAANSTPQAGSIGNAIMVWSGQGTGAKVISAFGATNSSIYDGTIQLVTNAGDTTAITGKATGITETKVSDTPTLLISSSDNTAWHYQASGTVTKVTSSGFPGNASKTLAGTFAHLDGYAFIMSTDGDIYNSDLNSVSGWTASNRINASAYPDQGVACIRWRNQIIGFGTQSMEFFHNAGNAAGSVLSRNASQSQKIGLCHANSITSFRDTLFWAGSGPEGGIGFYMLSDGVKRISTPAIDVKLTLAGASNISCSVYVYAGSTHVFVKAATLTMAYCVESDFWYEIAGSVPLWERSAAVSVGANVVAYGISTTNTSGKVYVLSPSSAVFRDDGAAYTATVITSPVDANTNRKKQWNTIDVVSDREVVTSPLSISWSDDDYQTFNTANARTVDLSQASRRSYRLGVSAQRVWRFDHSANSPMRIRAVEIDAEVLSV